MTLIYIVKLGFATSKTSVKAKKIARLPLKTHGIVSDRFLPQNYLNKV